MKLYATVTSERASKGQGGNNRCDGSFTVERMGESLEVVRVLVQRNEDNSYRIVVSLPHHQSTETVLEMNEHNNLYSIEERVRDGQKGEKQKGERMEWCQVCETDTAHNSLRECMSCK